LLVDEEPWLGRLKATRQVEGDRSMKLRIITQVGLAAFFVTIGPSWAQDRPLEVTDSLPSQAVTQKVQTSDKEPAVKPLSRERHPRYRVRSGDEFEIAFTFTPEFNQAVTIQPDGYITLREIGDIYVQGQTVPELIKTIRTAYEEILRDPAVSITLTNVEMPYFIAAGWLRSPGKYDLRGRTTVAEAVNIAGGFTDESKHSGTTPGSQLRRSTSKKCLQRRICPRTSVCNREISYTYLRTLFPRSRGLSYRR
jgi:hypothetical protein